MPIDIYSVFQSDGEGIDYAHNTGEYPLDLEMFGRLCIPVEFRNHLESEDWHPPRYMKKKQHFVFYVLLSLTLGLILPQNQGG